MMSRFLIVYLCALGALGCDDGRSAFNRTYSSAVCERTHECAPGIIDSVFGTEGECRATVESRFSRYQSDESCRYDEDAAEDCMSQTYRISCEVWIEYGEPGSCGSVYTCTETDRSETHSAYSEFETSL